MEFQCKISIKLTLKIFLSIQRINSLVIILKLFYVLLYVKIFVYLYLSNVLKYIHDTNIVRFTKMKLKIKFALKYRLKAFISIERSVLEYQEG